MEVRPKPHIENERSNPFVHEEEPHVFGLAGLPGSGKSTAAEIMQFEIERNHLTARVHEVSDFVRGMFEAEHRDEEIDDNELGAWAAEQKEKHGQSYFVKSLAEQLDVDDRPHLIIPGLRSPAEAQALRATFGGENTYIIAIWTLPDIRFERKYGATPSADHPEWDTFEERNQRELHEWNCLEFFTEYGYSDYIVPNNTQQEDLEARLRRIVGEEVFDSVRPKPNDMKESPFPDDIGKQRLAQYL